MLVANRPQPVIGSARQRPVEQGEAAVPESSQADGSQDLTLETWPIDSLKVLYKVLYSFPAPTLGRDVRAFVIAGGLREPITIYGDGTQTRSFCYAEDLVDGLLLFMNTDDSITGPINLGNPADCTIKTLAEKVITLTGSRSKLEFRPLPSDDPRQRKPDITATRTILGWSPKVELENGLRTTIAYFEQMLSREGGAT